MLCPRCNPGGGGTICQKFVADLDRWLYLCDECDATWESQAAVGTEPSQNYSTYLRQRGIEPSWDGLLPVLPIQN